MSTKEYSMDLRIRVVGHVELGHSQASTALLFKIGATTVRRWWDRYKEEGNCKPRRRMGRKPSLEKEKLISYVKSNPSAGLIDMGKVFGMTDVGVLYWLRKLGFSYKKKGIAIWKQIGEKEKNILKK